MAGTCGEEELDWLLRRIEEGILKALQRSLTLLCVATVGTAFLLSIGCNLWSLKQTQFPFGVRDA